jgi:hypothetical protein
VAEEEAGFDAVLGSDHFHPWVDDTSAAGIVSIQVMSPDPFAAIELIGKEVLPRSAHWLARVSYRS